jgi:hypothetical protein
MTENIDRLWNSLLRIASKSLCGDEFFGKPDVIKKELERVRSTFNSSSNDSPPQERISSAITKFLESKSIQDANQTRLISWGLSLPCSDERALLDLTEPFSIFFNSVKTHSDNQVLSTKAWRGLLSSYFNYHARDSHQVGRSNWKSLREFLKETFASQIEKRKVKPLWANALEAHLNLFEDNPCERYASALLQGDNTLTAELKTALAIPETSWFFSELVGSQIKHACSQDDSRYKQCIPHLARTLRTAPLYIRMGLTDLLTRYRRCSDTSEHSELSDLSIEHWGNPKLDRNTSWGHVSPDVKGMVLKWLIGRDLETFFDLMTSDNHADQDQRRLKFWRCYLGNIQDAYFALGSNAWYSQNQDYVELRRRNDGRVVKLIHPDQANNAFIMLIGRFVIVEFGVKGNACYCFDRENLPFRLNARELCGDVTQLKNKTKGYRFHLSHFDRGGESWEETFENKLSELSISPDKHIPKVRYQNRERQRYSERDSSFRSAHSGDLPFVPESAHAKFKMDELKDFVGRFGLKVIDLRGRGGNLWVKPDCDMVAVANELRRWKFERKIGKGWWLK